MSEKSVKQRYLVASGVFFFAVIFLTLFIPWKRAEALELETKEIRGIKFKVPSDWPIEERQGTAGPIPVEEYLAQRFSKMDTRSDESEAKISELQNALNDTKTELANLKEKFYDVEERFNDIESWLKYGNARRLG